MNDLQIHEIEKSIDGTTILSAVSFNLPKGQFLGIAGPDGSGKSTLLKIIAGIWGSDAGTLSVNGHSYRQFPKKLKERIGYMSFEEGVYQDFTGEENLRYAARLYD
ncbi:MAG: ATP-binding cassette domain-containing protein, partial [bacterium]|nr:ATP-binding cassette domain-containing protein [bacterium]